MKTDNVVFGCFGIGIAFILLLVLSAIINGFVLSILWSWFIVPLFGLPTLTIPQAIGISMIVSYLTRHSVLSGNEKQREWLDVISDLISWVIAYPLFVLFTAWVVVQFL